MQREATGASARKASDQPASASDRNEARNGSRSSSGSSQTATPSTCVTTLGPAGRRPPSSKSGSRPATVRSDAVSAPSEVSLAFPSEAIESSDSTGARSNNTHQPPARAPITSRRNNGTGQRLRNGDLIVKATRRWLGPRPAPREAAPA